MIPQSNPQPVGTVGAFEGAHYYHCGAYRPQWDCRMRALGFPFCAVCRRRITQTLTPYLPIKTILKELKDAKHEKIEKIEKMEFKELKIEKFEFKEFEKRLFEFPKLKDAEIDPQVIDPEIGQRLARLEADVQRLTHFIEREDRPDVQRGALANERASAAPARKAPAARARSTPSAPAKRRRST